MDNTLIATNFFIIIITDVGILANVYVCVCERDWFRYIEKEKTKEETR